MPTPRVESTFIQLDPIRAHVLRWPASGGARPVVLLHGLASNARIWELVAPHLAAAGLAPLAPDLRGHGLTDKPDAGYTLEAMAGDLRSLIAGLGLRRPLLVGHSWGAALALEYAARHRAGRDSPAGLGLVDGGMSQLDDVPGATWERVSELLAPPRLAGLRPEELRARLAGPDRPWRADGRAQDIILANFEIAADGTLRPWLTYERHMQLLRELWEQRTYAAFGRLSCPVLMVPARSPGPARLQEEAHAILKEKGIARARAAVSRLRVVWMPDTVHDIPLQRPEALAAQLVAFARSLASGA